MLHFYDIEFTEVLNILIDLKGLLRSSEPNHVVR